MNPSASSRHGRLPLFALLLLALGAGFFLAFGIVGIGRGGGEFAFDMQYLHVAGEMWENGQTPYSADQFKSGMEVILGASHGNYAYPPNSSALAMLLALSGVTQAKATMALLNILSLVAMIGFVHWGAAQSDRMADPGLRLRDLLLTGAVILGNPFAAHVSWMGQTTLVSGAFILGCWLCADQKRDVAAGLLLALGAFKPQLAILVGLWFLLDRRWLLLVSAAAGTVALSAWPLAATGLGGSWLGWLAGLREYQDTQYNVAGFRHLFGIQSALANFGIAVPSLALVAVPATVLLHLQRRFYDNIWLIGVIFGLSFLFVYAHDYDIAPATILTYPLLRASRGHPARLGLVLLAALVLFFPQRIWEAAGLGAFARSRELALMVLLGVYLIACRAPQGQGRLQAA